MGIATTVHPIFEIIYPVEEVLTPHFLYLLGSGHVFRRTPYMFKNLYPNNPRDHAVPMRINRSTIHVVSLFELHEIWNAMIPFVVGLW